MILILLYWTCLSLLWFALTWQLFRYGHEFQRVSEKYWDPVPVLIALILIAARWPTLLLNHHLNPDESWLIAGALAFANDPVPWRGADLTTSGPFNSYILALPLLFGFPLDYAVTRLLGIILVGISAICWYLTIKKLRGRFVALFVLIPAIFFFSFVRGHNFIHYSTELLPIALLSLATWVTVSSTVSSTESPSHHSNIKPFLAALLLSIVPFAKLQAAPLAVVLFLLSLVYLHHSSRMQSSKRVIAFILGAFPLPVAIVTVLISTGVFEDAWRSYFLSNLHVSALPMSAQEFWRFVFFTNMNLTISMAVLFAIIIISGAYNALSKGFSEKTPLLFYGSLIYLVTTIYVIWKPGNPWGHYLLFAIPAVVFLTASLASPQAFAIPFNRLWLWLDRPVRPLQTYAPLLLLTVCFAAGILAALLTNGPWPLRAAQHQHNNYVAKIITVLLRGDQEFMIWGFMPQYYALTGARPTTRDVITQYQVWDNPQKDYFRDRFIADLKKSPPNIIVDAMGEGNFHFKFHPLVPIEQFEELNNYIHENYALLIDLGQCATPITRIFVSHTRLGQLKLPSDFQSISTTICGDKDLTRLLSLLRMGDSVHAPR